MNRQKSHVFLFPVLFLIIIFSVGASHIPARAAVPNKSGHRTVKIGYSFSSGYYNAVTDGVRSGYGYSYDQALAQYAGWDIEYVDGSWHELQQMLADGRIDLLGFLVDTEEREKIYDFSNIPAGDSMSCLIAREDNEELTYEDFEAFDEISVACIRGNVNNPLFQAYCTQHGFSVELVEFDDYTGVYDAVDEGLTDAGLLTDYQNVYNYNIIDKFFPTNFYYAVKKGNNSLFTELHAALNDIHIYYSDFNSMLYETHYESSNGRTVDFNQRELAYLSTHPTVTVLAGARMHPYEAYDQNTGTYTGIVPDVLKQVSEITGIRFEYEEAGDGSSAKQPLTGNTIVSITNNFDWASGRTDKITQPFVQASVVAVGKRELSDIQKVSLVENGYISSVITRLYPD